jgi:hypothetical protein
MTNEGSCDSYSNNVKIYWLGARTASLQAVAFHDHKHDELNPTCKCSCKGGQ